MHFTNVLALAVLAATSVYAYPGTSPELTERNDRCPGDQEWCGWSKSCKCDKRYWWDNDLKKCHYPAWPKPQCGKDEKPYCGKGEKDWCEYDPKNDKCWNDGHNKAFCCKDKDLPKKLKDKCPDDHPKCRDTEVWDGDDKRCKCPNGKVWRNGKCRHPYMPKPGCDGKKKPYCAKNKDKWCPWDDSKDECSDTGKHITFCCEPGKERDWTNKNWDL